jgi:hypothetical protein
MSVPGVRLAGRLVGGAIDVAHERAPGFSERAYRTVAVPLMLADPAAAAQAVELRLDGTRSRVAAMAAKGTVPTAGVRRVRRDLARTRTDLEHLAPRLPVVQARCLTVRSASYTDVLQKLSDPPVRRGGQSPVWDVAVLVASLAAWIGIFLLVTGPFNAALLGLVAGVGTALFIARIRTRRAGRVRIGALVEALVQADAVAIGPSPASLSGLDRERQVLSGRVRASGRLDQRGLSALGSIQAHLDDLLLRLVEGDLEADGAHLVQATVERYLPDTLEPLLALSDAQLVARGQLAAAEVADQLTAIDTALADLARRPSRVNPEQQLFRQGEFLRSKFGT